MPELITGECVYAFLSIFFSFGGGGGGLSGRASDPGARGRRFETYLHHVVSLSKTLYSPKYW